MRSDTGKVEDDPKSGARQTQEIGEVHRTGRLRETGVANKATLESRNTR